MVKTKKPEELSTGALQYASISQKQEAFHQDDMIIDTSADSGPVISGTDINPILSKMSDSNVPDNQNTITPYNDPLNDTKIVSETVVNSSLQRCWIVQMFL